ncbi:glycoside hydrolase family 105 protein [Paenibacillus allorhizosphaerae]|uniref:Unsaturated rhamnogalacturonyl hydrolase YteR n=1 Tax=Paenibacillus allorhizosphaerae TaxID=2849866 RepID=A0ABM8VFW6_9BACL|nr:glycoside hydrolase family 88 protein [Paenibacillus allorhizosphaerae]CAG7636203.1 Unsaturated rhamnogalacturonyl hydrolase YteR [Paenibacillus allorhizosphaerae]
MSVPWSVAMSESFMKQYPLVSDMPFQKRRCWNYENGCILTAFERMWERTGDDRYFRYIKENMDLFIREDGSIDTYSLNEYNVDMTNQGKTLFLLQRETGDDKYRKAIELLVTQLKGHPRTSEGGLWHKKIYPFQMWLDGVYMTSPFLAHYAQTFGEHEWYDDVANEILLMERVSRDPRTGLLYHGWDESREQRWADKQTGCSPNFWGRALGWYVMAVVDVLDFLPMDHPKRGQVIGIFYRLAEAIMDVQDQESGLWYQVLNQGGREGNYLESSASAMFACALAKGARKGYLGGSALQAARKGHQGLLDRYVERDADDSLHLNGICSVAGLGNKPYRDGSYEYYISEPTRRDDPKGFAPFVMACLEIEALES